MRYLEQNGEVVDHRRWRERRPHLADSVYDHSFVRRRSLVRNGERHGVLAAARRVDEGAIGDVRSRHHLAMVTDATLDHLERDDTVGFGASKEHEEQTSCPARKSLQPPIDRDRYRQERAACDWPG